MYKQDTDELKRIFNSAVSLFGTPKLLVCDRGRMFESSGFVHWMSELGCNIHYITPEMHHANGQPERYARTVLNLIRVESRNHNDTWSDVIPKIQLVLYVTKQKSTQYSALYLLIGTNATTPVIRALVRDIAIEGSNPNHEAMRAIARGRAKALLKRNESQQNTRVNRHRHPPRIFKVDDQVFVIKYSQSTGKLDSGMRGPYRVTKVTRVTYHGTVMSLNCWVAPVVKPHKQPPNTWCHGRESGVPRAVLHFLKVSVVL